MFNSNVWKTWTLILQLGISVLVPVFLLLAIAYFIEQKCDVNLILIFVIIGVIVGVRNAYMLIKNHLDSTAKPGESELLKKHLKNIEKNKK